MAPLRANDWQTRSRIRRSLLHLDGMALVVLPPFLAGKVNLDRLSFRKRGRSELQVEDSELYGE